jgi:hypothetical protein
MITRPGAALDYRATYAREQAAAYRLLKAPLGQR